MNEPTQRPLQLVVLLFLLAVAAAPIAAAGPPPAAQAPAYQPPVFTKGQISLMDAVRISLEHDPNVRLQAEATNVQKGLAQVATGQFDTSLIGSLSYDFTQQQLTAQERSAEEKKREGLRKQVNEAKDTEDADNAELAELVKAHDVVQNNGDPSTVHFADPAEQAQFELYFTILQAAPPAAQPGIRQDLLDFIDGLTRDTVKDRDQAHTQRLDYQHQLDQLGKIPEIERTYDADLKLQLQTLYRNGVTFTPFFDLSMTGSGYQGKPKAAALGGKGVLDNYQTQVGFTVDLPLGRGRGVEATGAPEKAAQINYQASLSTLVHTAATSVFNASVAYWSVVGAERNVKVLEENLALQQRLVELTKALIDADEIPRSELARAQAAEANARAQLEDARRTEHEARLTLAQAIGLEVDQEVNAPGASDAFPAVPDDAALRALAAQPLGDEAVAQRYDLKAALQLQQSGGVLLRAAVLNLKRVTDLQLKLFYSGEGDSSVIMSGLRGAFLGRWVGPSASFTFNVEYPFANNVQKGLLTQQEGQYNQQAITARDIERLIRSDVVLAIGSLQEAARQVRQFDEAVGYYRQSIEAEMEKLKLGSSTLIDTLTTQQRLTDALLAQATSQQQYAQTLARLRFETGTLVAEQPGGKMMVLKDLTALPGAAAPAR